MIWWLLFAYVAGPPIAVAWFGLMTYWVVGWGEDVVREV